jgi:DNA replication protein DnaC
MTPQPDAAAAERLEAQVAAMKARKAAEKPTPAIVAPVEPFEFVLVPREETVFLADDPEREIREREQRRREAWNAMVPAIYREPIDFAKVNPEANRDELGKILGWQYGPRGLYIIGHTGLSKSRALCSMVGDYAIYSGRSVKYLDGVAFAIGAGAAMGNPETAERWLKSLCAPDILIIDDFAKRWTPSTEEAAFAVVERRTAWRKPIMITNNYDRDEMIARAHDRNVVEPMLRRLKDYCEIASI